MVNQIIGNVTIGGQVIQSTSVTMDGPGRSNPGPDGPDGPDAGDSARSTADLARGVTEDLAHPGAQVRLTHGEHRAVLRLLAHLDDTGAPEAAVARELADRLRGRSGQSRNSGW
ncbi:hypothetical protein ACFXPX_27290 [Kitasatospora sp. NPDC059146]|uniref:hypothetical protein n=1 Tax=Kitasatospora sp. NPDC059146 TaxID=3346741 RepID=UPI00368FDB4E